MRNRDRSGKPGAAWVERLGEDLQRRARAPLRGIAQKTDQLECIRQSEAGDRNLSV
jgi:hypothetical protein